MHAGQSFPSMIRSRHSNVLLTPHSHKHNPLVQILIMPILDEPPYTLQNLPYGVISTQTDGARCAVAIGHHAIDLVQYAKQGCLEDIEKSHSITFKSIFAEVVETFPTIRFNSLTISAVQPEQIRCP